MTILGKIIKWFFITLLGLLGLVAAGSVVVGFLDTTLNLDSIRPAVEAAMSSALNRRTHIKGSISLIPTLRPTLEIQGVQIDNPEGWKDPVFLAIDLARVQVGLLPLLKKQIDVGEITCQNVTVNLETSSDGRSNWHLAATEENVARPQGQPVAESPGSAPAPAGIGLQALDRLMLQQIRVHYRDNSLGKEISFILDELSGTAKEGEPLALQGRGRVQDKTYTFTLDGGALEAFHLRQQLYPLTLAGTIVNSPFTARGEFGMDNGEPKLDLKVMLARVDIGALLAWLQLAEGVEAATDQLALDLKLRGDTLHRLVTESNMMFSLRGGHYVLHGAGRGEGVPLAIARGEISSLSGRPVNLRLDGTIDRTPVNIAMHGMELVNYVARPAQLPLTIEVKAAGTSLDFQGKVAMPIRRNFSLHMDMQGEKLNSLDELLGIDLPPLGPYSLGAEFTMHDRGYELTDLRLKVGSSDLHGRMRLDMTGEKPRAEVELVSRLLQLNDFDTGDWSPEGTQAVKTDLEPANGKPPAADRHAEQPKPASLLSQEALSRADAHLQVKFDKVMSGRDTLGSGQLVSTLEDGRFSIEPLELQLAHHGMARVVFSYAPTRDAARMHLAANVDRLDVGILARRLKPGTRMGGTLYLDVLLDATAPSLDQLMAHGRGHFDLAFLPKNFDARIVDLWAINLLSALASEVDGRSGSHINCLVASFAMQDGLMRDRVMFMDTTRMSIEGQATINFKTRQLDVIAGPKAKRPEFFSLATPVKISGTFDDFGIGISVVRLTGTVASFITSPVHVPLRRIFAGTIPADGRAACLEAWEKRNLKQ